MSDHGGARDGAGRPPGAKSKKTIQVEETLQELDCDPITGMAKIAMGDVPCNLCGPDGMVTVVQFYRILGKNVPDWVLDEAEDGDSLQDHASNLVRCPSCAGTKIDPVNITLRSSMFKELAQYVAPKRKAIEHTGVNGEKLTITISNKDSDL